MQHGKSVWNMYNLPCNIQNFSWKQQLTPWKNDSRNLIWGEISVSSVSENKLLGVSIIVGQKNHLLDTESIRYRLKNITKTIYSKSETKNNKSKGLPKLSSMEIIFKFATPPHSFRSRARPQVSCPFRWFRSTRKLTHWFFPDQFPEWRVWRLYLVGELNGGSVKYYLRFVHKIDLLSEIKQL